MDCLQPRYFANKVLMIRPTSFFANPETIQDNHFMNNLKANENDSKIHQEFENLKTSIQKSGIEVVEYKQMSDDMPDSVFPNNWISTHIIKHQNKNHRLMIVYPMRWPSRQKERNPQIVEDLRPSYKHFIDLDTDFRNKGALEGTGCLIFDNKNKKIFCALSERCDEQLATHLTKKINKIIPECFKLVMFQMFDQKGRVVYHTNVGFGILSNHVVLCVEAIHKEDRQRVIDELTSKELCTHSYQLIDISFEEMNGFCGNVICLDKGDNVKIVLMSERARKCFSANNLKILETNYQIVSSDVSKIEEIGGGGARCMVAELF